MDATELTTEEKVTMVETLNAQIAGMAAQKTAAPTQQDRDCWELRLRVARAELRALRGR